jgi:hypothetical protein
MLKRCMALTAVLVAAAVAAAPAGAATAKPTTKSVSLSFNAATLPQLTNTDAGVVTGSLGKGAIVIVGATAGTVTIFYANGSISGKFAITPTTNPDGSAAVSGTATVTGGTGTYAGAKGKGTLSGVIAADGSVTGTAKAKITY